MKPSQKHADKIFYEMAGAEIESGQIDKGLMVKAISKSGGDKKKAEIIYLEWRVELLKEQAIGDAERAERKKVADEAKAVEEAENLTQRKFEQELKQRIKKEEKEVNEHRRKQRELPWYKREDFIICLIIAVFLLSLILGIYFVN
jgi:hypothetical protein